METFDSPGKLLPSCDSSMEENKYFNVAPTSGGGNWEIIKREEARGEYSTRFNCTKLTKQHQCEELTENIQPSTYCEKKCNENEGLSSQQGIIKAGDVKGNRRKQGRPFNYKRILPLRNFLIFIVIMDSLPGIDPSVLSNTICKFLQYKNECERDLRSSLETLNNSKLYCPGEFDDFVCWPYMEAGNMAVIPCPDFYKTMNGSQFGYRFCQSNGSWYQAYDPISGSVIPWRHIDDCGGENETDFPEEDESQVQLLTNLRIMYTVGYGVSLVCLVIALMLLGFFKKLHCTRNYIHMNLMVSFILRYVVILVKDSVLLSHYQLDGLADTGTLNYDQLRQYCDEDNSAGWVLTRCRLVITLMHYAITANYFWLLAEGLYLQMLLVFVMSENKYFAGFMVFGWGAPWVSVLIWVALRMQYENSGCWDINDIMHIWWTIRAPIIVSIVINFFIFINIVRLIVSKLQAHNMARTDIKLRLAKSTLALIPLLGIHYIVFLALTEEVADTSATPMLLRLAFDMFLSSIQGTLVSILYCFLNSEVRTEVRRAWDVWRSHKDLPKGSNFRKTSTNHSTQVTQLYSRHSTNVGDFALQESCQSGGNSYRSEGESRQNSLVPQNNSLDRGSNQALTNGNGIAMDTKKKQIYYDRLNGNAATEEYDSHSNGIETTVAVDGGNEPNGDIECSDDVPFIHENAV